MGSSWTRSHTQSINRPQHSSAHGWPKNAGPVKLIDRGPYAETLIKKGLLDVSDPELECLDCADDAVLDHYWKDLYKYTPRPAGGV